MSNYFEQVFGTMVNHRGTSWYKYEPGLIGLARGEIGSISKSKLRSILKNPWNKDFTKKLLYPSKINILHTCSILDRHDLVGMLILEFDMDPEQRATNKTAEMLATERDQYKTVEAINKAITEKRLKNLTL